MILPSLMSPQKLYDTAYHAAISPDGGCFVEIGVYKGGSAQVLYDVAERSGRKLHLFDTFTGIPVSCAADYVGAGEFKATEEDLENIKKQLPNAQLHIGFFPATVPETFELISFIHFDGDQYHTAKGIKCLWHRVIKGGIVFIDDYEGFSPGLKTAFREDYPKIPVCKSPSGQFYFVKE